MSWVGDRAGTGSQTLHDTVDWYVANPGWWQAIRQRDPRFQEFYDRQYGHAWLARAGSDGSARNRPMSVWSQVHDVTLVLPRVKANTDPRRQAPELERYTRAHVICQSHRGWDACSSRYAAPVPGAGVDLGNHTRPAFAPVRFAFG